MEPVHAFVLAILDIGDRLTGIVENLIASYAAAAECSEDEATTEVIAMLLGTTSVRLASVADEDFARATELLRRTFTVVLADVEQAAELARQKEFRNHATSTHGRPL